MTLPAWGITYYVDSSRPDDAGNGQSPTTAWKTINKVNTSSFSSGDSILFKRGSLWRESLVPPSSGSSAAPITFGDYGTGNKPSIRGSNLYNTAGSWTNESSNLWYRSPVAKDPEVFVHDGTLENMKPAKKSLASQWDCWYDSTNKRLYIYSTANPTTLATNLEVPIRNRILSLTRNSYLTFQNLDIRHNRGDVTWCGWGAQGITFSRCDFSQIGQHCLSYHNGSSGAVQNCTFTDWGLANTNGYAITVIGYRTTNSGPVDITGCTFTVNGTSNQTECMPLMQDQMGWVRNFNNNVVNGNGKMVGQGVCFWRPGSNATSITCQHNIIKGTTNGGIVVQELEYYGAAPKVIVMYNWLEATCAGDVLDTHALRTRAFSFASKVTVAYNIINGTQAGSHAHPGIQNLSGVNTKIYNNVIYGCDNGIEVNDISGVHSTGLTIRNNIFMANRVYGIAVGANNTVQNFDHNCFYNNALGNYNGIAPGLGDVTSNPNFVKPGKDFHLQPSSPCRNPGF